MATRATAEERDRAAVEASKIKESALAKLEEIRADATCTPEVCDALGRYLLTARKRGAADPAKPKKARAKRDAGTP